MITLPLKDGPEQFLCLRCSTWIIPSVEPMFGCPNCGESKGTPASSKDYVDVRVTWHELRLLVIWAENWANKHKDSPGSESMPRVVYGIADRLMSQHLDQKTGLTLSSEIAELRAAFGPKNVETNIPDPPEPL